MAIVGIDLGTTMSAIARLDEMGKPVVIPNSEGHNITPSVVLFDGKNSKVVGQVAKQSAVAFPGDVVFFVKNEMGHSKTWNFGGETYNPEDISAVILRRLKDDAEQIMGEAIEGAVITVPAIFGDAERDATKTAATIAGLKVIAILEEPVAAALSYGLGRETSYAKPSNVLVYDLGGGTFDLTVMQMAGNKIKMLATDGDRSLGGRNWDDKIVEYVARQFETEHGQDPRLDPEAASDLRGRAEDAKHTLSRLGRARMVCQYGGKISKPELTRDIFNELTSELLAQTETTTLLVLAQLKESGKLPGGWADIDKVLMAGGSTRMPQVGEMLQRISGKEPEMLEVDLVVAQGAALYAVHKVIIEAEIAGTTAGLVRLGLPPGIEELLSATEVTRVCSFALGVAALDKTGRNKNAVLVSRNAELPAQGSKVFGTSDADQREILVTVLEGEDEDPSDCQELGKALISDIPPGLPKGSPVEVTIQLNDEVNIIATAVEQTHGRRCTFVLKREMGKSETEVEFSRNRLRLDTVE